MISDRHLVPVKPALFADFDCPKCGGRKNEPRGTVFPGVNVLGSYRCGSCGLEFLRDLPVGFAVDHPLAIGTADGKLFNPANAEAWLVAPLMEAYTEKNNAEVRIERRVLRACTRVVILDTLDFLYGHVLLKLYNAQHYIDAYPDLGTVIILPRMYEWLIPEGAAEVWLVDLKLSRMHAWYERLDAFVRTRLAEYDEVYLAKGYAHPDFSRIDIARFTGIAPFPLAEFNTRAPHITFVMREDRLWHASPVGKFLHRACGKLGLGSTFGGWSLIAQDRLIRSTMFHIRAHVPEVTFTIVGLGIARKARSGIEDLRTDRMDAVIERSWCAAYAKSQIVIGVHGSNMLLPTAFAAGCIEILPHDRYGNVVQDISVRWADRMQLFLYRFVDEFASPRAVARHAASMLHDFAHYHRNNRENTFEHVPRS